MFSPGYAPRQKKTYPPRRLSYYHVKCAANITFVIRDFHLQPRINAYPNKKVCVDYIRLTGDGITSPKEYCGKIQPKADPFDIDSGNVLVTFRSSRFNNYQGFHIVAICRDNNVMFEQDQPGCLKMNTMDQKPMVRV